MQKNNFTLITGAASGIGRAYAVEVARRGGNVVLVDRNVEAMERLAGILIADYGVSVRTLALDLTLEGAADRIVAYIEELGLQVDTLICNAGMLLFGGFASCSPEAIDRILALHCRVTTQLCHRFGARMRAQKAGRILLMASATAWMPYPSIALYAATKRYLTTFGEALHDEWAADGVTVTVVCPGAVDTPLYHLDEKLRHRLLSWRIMHRPEAIARRALRALDRGRKRLIPGFFTRLAVVGCRLCPSWVIRRVVRLNRVRRLLE